MGYDGPCADLHGHTYTAIIEFGANFLDEIGFVVDFSDIKRYIKTWVDEKWDHGTLLSSEDEELIPHIKGKLYLFDKKNPTAEVMAEELFDKTMELMGNNDFTLKSVIIKETPTSEALYTPFG